MPPDPARGYTKSSKFWGVSWHKGSQLWRANYLNKDNRLITIGNYATEAEAALAVNVNPHFMWDQHKPIALCLDDSGRQAHCESEGAPQERALSPRQAGTAGN